MGFSKICDCSHGQPPLENICNITGEKISGNLVVNIFLYVQSNKGCEICKIQRIKWPPKYRFNPVSWKRDLLHMLGPISINKIITADRHESGFTERKCWNDVKYLYKIFFQMGTGNHSLLLVVWYDIQGYWDIMIHTLFQCTKYFDGPQK